MAESVQPPLQPLTIVLVSPMQARSERIAQETPDLHVMAVHESAPRPYLLVKDGARGIILTLSSEEEDTLYCQLVLRQHHTGKEAAR